jgi:hypothetical protein
MTKILYLSSRSILKQVKLRFYKINNFKYFHRKYAFVLNTIFQITL